MKLSTRLLAISCVLISFQVIAVVGMVKLTTEQPFSRPYFATPVTNLADPVDPLVDHVVVFVFDGARYDMMMNETGAPTLKKLRDEGVLYANHETNYPSYSRPSYATIGTGTYSYEHQVLENSMKILPATETIFEVIQDEGLTSATLAFSWYRELFGPWVDTIIENNSVKGYAETQEYSKQLQNLLQTPTSFPNLTFVHMLETDDVGHAHGGLSPQVMEAVTHEDTVVRDFLTTLQNTPLLSGNTAIIVTADHGMTDSDGGSGNGWGSHGMSSEAELHVPLFMWGPSIKQGAVVTTPSNHIDVAETIAYLLGTRVPKDSSGTVLFDAFTGAGEVTNQRQNLYLHQLTYRNLAKIDRVQESSWQLADARVEMLLKEKTTKEKRAEADAILVSDAADRQEKLESLEESTDLALEVLWTAQVSRRGTWQLIPYLFLMFISIFAMLLLLKGEGEGVSFATINFKDKNFIFAMATVGAMVIGLLPLKYHANSIASAGLSPLAMTPLTLALVNGLVPLIVLIGAALVMGKDGEEKLALVGIVTLIANFTSASLGIGYQAYHFGLTSLIYPFSDVNAIMLAYHYIPSLVTFGLFLLIFIVGKVYLHHKGSTPVEKSTQKLPEVTSEN